MGLVSDALKGRLRLRPDRASMTLTMYFREKKIVYNDDESKGTKWAFFISMVNINLSLYSPPPPELPQITSSP